MASPTSIENATPLSTFSIIGGNNPVTTPPLGAIVADYYQPMTDGNDTDLVTPAIMESGDIIITDSPILEPLWTQTGNGVFVSTEKDMTLPVPVDVEGTEHTINSGKSWRWLNEFNGRYVELTIEKFFAIQNYSQFTVGCYYIPDHDTVFANFHDTIIINTQSGSEFGVLQTNNAGGNLTINAHTSVGDSPSINITRGTRYWVNLLFDGTNEVCKVSVYDDTNFQHIAGSPQQVGMIASQVSSTIRLGRTDGHTGNPNFGANNSSWIGQLVMRLSGNGPLLPAGA